MATPLEEIQNLMRNPGMSRTPVGSISSPGGNRDVPGPPSSVGRGRTQKRASASATGSTRANVRRPGISAGVSSVPTANPATRVQNALNIMESPVQRSRQSTEAKLNPEVGENLRLAMNELQRVSGPTFGSQGAFERRDRREAREAAQAAVDSGLGALQGIREGALTDRGQTLEATTLLEDRQMQEAGAFDRALLGLDEAMLKGQFGLAGIAAERADPLRDFALTQLEALAGGENATAADQRQALNASLGLSEFAGPGGGATATASATGLDVQFTAEQLKDPTNVALAARALPADKRAKFLDDLGYVPDPESVLGITTKEEASEKAEERRAAREAAAAEEEKQRKAAVAKYIQENPLDPSVRTRAINNQTR